MNAAKFRDLLRAQPFRRFLVKTSHGDTFTVDHPEFALVGPLEGVVAIFDKDEHFRIVSMDHVVTLGPVRNGAKKPGKR
jgi:hypothetical protein